MKDNNKSEDRSVMYECNVDEIIVPKGKSVNTEKVKQLADSIQHVGLINPILITPEKNLLAGLHRLEAFKLLGLAKIPVIVKAVNGLKRDLTAIDEDYCRKHLDYLELGLLWKTRKDVLEQMGQLAKRGENKHTMKKGAKTTKDLAKEFHTSERDLQKTFQTLNNLAPEAIENIRGTEIAKNKAAVGELSRQPKHIQIAAAEKIKAKVPFRDALKNSYREETTKKLEAEAKNYTLPNYVNLFCGDFRTVCRKLPDSSIQLLLTDPLYCKDALDDYRDLAKVAYRVLKPKGFLVVYCGNLYFDEILKAFTDAGFSYHWIGGVFFTNGRNREKSRGIITRYRPVLFFTKQQGTMPIRYIHDMFGCTAEKALHVYQQNIEPVRSWIMSLTEPGDTVLDCFLGSGTTGVAAALEKRKFIGIDIDKKALATATARIKMAVSGQAGEMQLKKAA